MRKPRKRVDLEEVIEMRIKGASVEDIALKLEASPAAVYSRLSELGLLKPVRKKVMREVK